MGRTNLTRFQEMCASLDFPSLVWSDLGIRKLHLHSSLVYIYMRCGPSLSSPHVDLYYYYDYDYFYYVDLLGTSLVITFVVTLQRKFCIFCTFQCNYRSGMVNSKSFITKVLPRINKIQIRSTTWAIPYCCFVFVFRHNAYLHYTHLH